jgi:hypothetical protein
MNWPFVTLARFDDMLREKNTQLAERDHRIAQLEAERRILCDKLFNAAFKKDSRNSSSLSTHAADPVPAPDSSEPGADIEESASQSKDRREPLSHRPSQIMRRMDRRAQERWLRKIHPAKAAEQERDRIMEELNTAHIEAVRAAAANQP